MTLRDVAQANGEVAGTALESEAEALSQAGGRDSKSLNSTLHAFGMRFAIQRRENNLARG
jgi:hypothetical protein